MQIDNVCTGGVYLDSLTTPTTCTPCTQLGYAPDTVNRVCLLCSAVYPNCQQCNIASNICTQCNALFYLSPNNQTCAVNCSAAYPTTWPSSATPLFCDTCNSAIYPVFLTLANVCTLCSSAMPNCKTCISSN